ncbi:MAG: ABC transporter ATP-binding protein [Saprospiraceae bacterium]|nr:ABC transporter ATP-binding protein [Saprospiraceae bacterium]
MQLKDCGKRYRFDWIFKGVNTQFSSGERYAILGPNGSGKSTLLKVLSGHLSPSRGSVNFFRHGNALEIDAVWRHVSYAAPYIELIEELTLDEAIDFHARLKPLSPGFDKERIHDLLQLPKTRQKEIRFFSSGMKQRVKLALAVCSDTPLLLLDEPATNLDTQGIAWYQQLLEKYAGDKLLIIASNDPHDAQICPRHLMITDYK